MSIWPYDMVWTVVAAALCVGLTVFLVVYLRRGASLIGFEPRCAVCGYRVCGLPTAICPECGSDLDVVGLRRPTRWDHLSPARRWWLLAAGWTTVMVWLALLAWSPFRGYAQPGQAVLQDLVEYASESGPYAIKIRRQWTFASTSCRAASTPPPGESPERVALNVYYKYSYTGRSSGLPDPNEVYSQYRTYPEFAVDLRDERYALCLPVPPKRGSSTSARPLVVRDQGPRWREQLDMWLGEAAKDWQYPKLHAEVREILDASLAARFGARTVPPSHVLHIDSWGSLLNWKPNDRYLSAFAAPFVALWLAGLFLIGRVFTRRRRAATA